LSLFRVDSKTYLLVLSRLNGYASLHCPVANALKSKSIAYFISGDNATVVSTVCFVEKAHILRPVFTQLREVSLNHKMFERIVIMSALEERKDLLAYYLPQGRYQIISISVVLKNLFETTHVAVRI